MLSHAALHAESKGKEHPMHTSHLISETMPFSFKELFCTKVFFSFPHLSTGAANDPILGLCEPFPFLQPPFRR